MRHIVTTKSLENLKLGGFKKGHTTWNKGKKMPHSKEWEEKRVKASRENSWKLKGRKNPKAKETIKLALEGRRRAEKENPKKYKQISINNLPKNRAGKNNGNWKGGVTVKTRGIRWSKEYINWRKSVFERDNYTCRNCGSKEKLEAHHIVSMKELPSATFIRANGVTLCKNCHKKTDSYAKNNQEVLTGITYIMRTIPQRWQDYETGGNYFTTNNRERVIFSSDFNNRNYSFLVLIHEMAEQYLCFKNGIKEEDIDKFDMENNDLDDPGHSKKAPYHKEHETATQIEKIVSRALGVDWKRYDKAYDRTVKKWRKNGTNK